MMFALAAGKRATGRADPAAAFVIVYGVREGWHALHETTVWLDVGIATASEGFRTLAEACVLCPARVTGVLYVIESSTLALVS